jgi:hypothetical protein
MELSDDLHARARAAAQATGAGELLDLAIRAAAEPDTTQRAWKLVALAARLRREGDCERALAILDAVDRMGPREDVRRAAFACAIAIHADRGDLDTAAKLAGANDLDHADPHELEALAHTYWLLWQETGDEDFRMLWRRCNVLLDAHDVRAA